MKKRVVLNKQIGQTPLEAIEAWRLIHPKYTNVPASYAGRLDPMASGKLLILLGDECKRQKKYTILDKKYEVEVLLDVGSDTGDILGIVHESPKNTLPNTKQLVEVLKSQVGTRVLPYPVYSSKTVQGKPLFLYALEGKLDSIEIPTHEETIYNIRLKGIYTLTRMNLIERVMTLLSLAPVSTEPSKKLGADFRIREVKESWISQSKKSARTFYVLRLTIFCASGTYMRTLASRIGSALGTSALALSIRRTRLGRGYNNPLVRLLSPGIW